MWVILVDTDLSVRRDNKISEIFNDIPVYNSSYLYKYGTKYSQSANILHAQMFKTESGAKRIVDEFNSLSVEDRRGYRSPFTWMANYHLSVKKLTQTEWDNYINSKISKEVYKHQKKIQKIESERNKFKG